VEGISHISIDGFDVWCLEDGTHTFDADVFPGLAFDEQQTRLQAAGETDIRTVFNAYLINDASAGVTLVDAGCGAAFGDNGGALRDRLAALSVTPADVTRLVFTHLHSDHCGGALDGDTPVFPNASVIMHPAEQAHWADEDAIAAKVIAAYADRITLAENVAEVMPGVSYWHLPGHTPGHCGLRVGQSLALIADAMHSEVLQIGDPRLGPIYDMDPATAVDSRLAALQMVADNGLIWSGSHMLGPEKFARLVQIGDGFVRVSL